MNKNHELLINNLTPVMWVGGAMGAFFMRFIESSNFVPNESQWENLEWFNWDRTLQYLEFGDSHIFYKKNINPHTSLLKEKYKGEEYDKALIYIIYQLTEPLVKEYGRYNQIHPASITLTPERLLELAEMDPIFDVNNLKFTHLKCHHENTNPLINGLNWKQKIHCQFPADKLWLIDILMFYKKCYYKIDKPNIDMTFADRFVNDPNSDSEEFYTIEWHKRLINVGKRIFSEVPGYISIDMYDLIFNKNVDQLKIAYPNFELSITQNKMLEKVKQDIIYICNVFELSPDISHVHLRDNKNIFNTNKINDILKKIGLKGPI